MKINVPTKYLFCIYSPKKCDYMIASFPTLQLAEYELSRLLTDEFFSDALISPPIRAEILPDSDGNNRFSFNQHLPSTLLSISDACSMLRDEYLSESKKEVSDDDLCI